MLEEISFEVPDEKEVDLSTIAKKAKLTKDILSKNFHQED
jgi:hypothetical protein